MESARIRIRERTRKRAFKREAYALLALLIAAPLAVGCSKSAPTCDTDDGRAAIVSAVDKALNSQDCDTAIASINPYYSVDGCGTDPVRTARASAYACRLGINFFGFIESLKTANFSAPTSLFNTLALTFPSTATDKKVKAGNFALDAIFALQNPDIETPDAFLIYADTVSPGTLIAANRSQDSNIYGMLTAMGMIGALQSRAGAPDATGAITQKLGATAAAPAGWEVAANMTDDGCAYVGSMLTFVDTVDQVALLLATRFGSSTADQLKTVAASLPLDAACAIGCNGAAGSGCSLSCSACPSVLRGRAICKANSSNDVATCAASGIVKAVNTLYGF